MSQRATVLITGTRKGIGRSLAEYYAIGGFQVIGCSRKESDLKLDNYEHYCLDVSDEKAIIKLFEAIRDKHRRLDILINNAGVASMNHSLLTPAKTVNLILSTNVTGMFIFCREAAKLMKQNNFGRIINFSTVAVPLGLAGEAIYAASKAAVVSLTKILAKEFADFGITVNAVGPNPIKTDLISAVPQEKIENLIAQQAIKRYGEFRDIFNVIDFFIQSASDFITGQVLYLGGI